MAASAPQTTDAAYPVQLEVLVLGFCRTGTASTRAALRILGYGESHHIGRVMMNPSEIEEWNALIDAKIDGRNVDGAQFKELLGNFKVVADVPGIIFAAELVQAYPQAKVILTTRDPDSWWNSLQQTLLVILDTRHTRLARWLDPHGLGKFVPFARKNLKFFLGPLDSIEEARAKRRYREYYEDIRSLVPSGKLLEYRMGEGWDRLCEFLNNDTPRQPFPHRNDSTSILEGSNKQIYSIYKRWAAKMLLPATVVLAVSFAVYAQTHCVRSTG
ncbi:P-loop containing nucleoside triphosphate hydrolase protein [Favolaschia claudopus]|uniref:P-loop containing nucleoside triphosphate hydrolase protein n=1 Tax=Favolaschia claudopus TaxID=2862362 RepID=A0AAV9ZQD1_9AGAR